MSISRVLVIVLSLVVVTILAGDRPAEFSGEFQLVPIPASAMHHGMHAAPNVRNKNGTSTNWSGYAVQTNLSSPASNAVTDVKGTWVVPTVVASTSATAYSSAWVGIDGYSSNSVEQLGTDQDWYNGKPSYYAWYEIYPKKSYLIKNFPVNPGDVITAEVKALSASSFALSITNVTRSVKFSTAQKCGKAQLSSAEWVMEAPWSGGVLPLADFGHINFTGCSATVNGVTGTINNPAWQNDAITMAVSGGAVKAQPSALSTDGSSFSVKWYHE
jgi:hypothetical protein